jgi:hypothetical protein
MQVRIGSNNPVLIIAIAFAWRRNEACSLSRIAVLRINSGTCDLADVLAQFEQLSILFAKGCGLVRAFYDNFLWLCWLLHILKGLRHLKKPTFKLVRPNLPRVSDIWLVMNDGWIDQLGALARERLLRKFSVTKCLGQTSRRDCWSLSRFHADQSADGS